MAVLPERKNTIVLARNFRNKITTRTQINDFDSDSKTNALVSVFIDEIVSLRNEVTSAFYANQISTANGTQLDQIGEDMGVPRLSETFAFALSQDQNVAFYVSSGNFGALNGGADIVIPAGTRLFSNANQNDLGSEIGFTVTQQATLSAASSIGYVNVRAEASGVNSNIGGGMLINHSFTGYTAGTGLLCINFFSILNGRGRERDSNYRFRLSRRYDTLISSNNSKLHLEALRVPGVLDTRVISVYYGIGTAAVVVLGPEGQATQNTVYAVQQRLNSISGPGSAFTAIPAVSVYVDLELEVKPPQSLTTTQKRQFELRVRRALRNYFRSQGIGGTFSLTAAAGEIRAYGAQDAKLVSSSRSEDIFSAVYVRKGPVGATGTDRDTLANSSYSLDEDEVCDLGTLSITYL